MVHDIIIANHVCGFVRRGKGLPADKGSALAVQMSRIKRNGVTGKGTNASQRVRRAQHLRIKSCERRPSLFIGRTSRKIDGRFPIRYRCKNLIYSHANHTEHACVVSDFNNPLSKKYPTCVQNFAPERSSDKKLLNKNVTNDFS